MRTHPPTRKSRAITGLRLKLLLADSGMTPEEAGKALHVTARTVRYWISGKVKVPYAAYRLLRIQRLWELPMPGWAGWHMHSGKLWSPEGHGFEPRDSAWWSLLVRQAKSFKTLYEREMALSAAMRAAGAEGAAQAAGRMPSASAAAGAATSTGVSRSSGAAAGLVPTINKSEAENNSLLQSDVIMPSWPTLYDFPKPSTLPHANAPTTLESASTPCSASPSMPTCAASPTSQSLRLKPKPRERPDRHQSKPERALVALHPNQTPSHPLLSRGSSDGRKNAPSANNGFEAGPCGQGGEA